MNTFSQTTSSSIYSETSIEQRTKGLAKFVRGNKVLLYREGLLY